MIALVDCNNFYVSCERVFNPKLHNRPVVVLSNDEGCIIARSSEIKNIGVPMGAPFFQYKNIIKEYCGYVLSANFELYQDISYRIMEILKIFSESMEKYSIDEAFLRFLSKNNMINQGITIRETILKFTGIPVSVGIATTKTLAKVAVNYAKKKLSGVVLIERGKNLHFCKSLNIEDIWGLSHGYKNKLSTIGINNVLQFIQASSLQIRKIIGVYGQKTQQELREVECFPFMEKKSKKNIMSSRSFGINIVKKEDLEEALSFHMDIVGEKMRKQGSYTKKISVFIWSSQQKYMFLSMSLDSTSSTSKLIKSGKLLLDKIFIPGLNYKKLGVIVSDFVTGAEIKNFFQNYTEADNVMDIVDNINLTMGKKTVFFASEGTKVKWKRKNISKSPCYTTKIQELPVVY